MAKFKIVLTREWSVSDTLERIIEADTIEQVEEIACAMCREYDHDCPDDVTTARSVSGEASDWDLETAEDYDGVEAADRGA